jgi:hypothetical protein
MAEQLVGQVGWRPVLTWSPLRTPSAALALAKTTGFSQNVLSAVTKMPKIY